jgi:SAM-dependent methyltransferase
MAPARLALRERQSEIMDEPGLDPARHASALRGLARINFVSRSAAVVWPELAALARRVKRPIRVLDLACGGGDVTAALRRRAARAGLRMCVEGCDVSATAVALARRAYGNGFFQLDVLHDRLPDGYDAVACSLFLHHLADDEAVAVLRKSADVAELVLVSDLERSRIGLLMVHVACRALTRSDVVRSDGPNSVRAAYTAGEARRLAARAGLDGAVVRRAWPCRFLLSWRRPGGAG